MTLRDLVLKMTADENLMVLHNNYTEWIECTPEIIINEYDEIADLYVSSIWYSTLFKAIMIELDKIE